MKKLAKSLCCPFHVWASKSTLYYRLCPRASVNEWFNIVCTLFQLSFPCVYRCRRTNSCLLWTKQLLNETGSKVCRAACIESGRGRTFCCISFIGVWLPKGYGAGSVWKWIWVCPDGVQLLWSKSLMDMEFRGKVWNGYWKITFYFGLKWVQGLENRAAHPHQNVWGVTPHPPAGPLNADAS